MKFFLNLTIVPSVRQSLANFYRVDIIVVVVFAHFAINIRAKCTPSLNSITIALSGEIVLYIVVVIVIVIYLLCIRG
jgi:hypothetical protein